jgi:hypothetical protein
MIWPVVSGVGDVEVVRWLAAAERLVRADVPEDVVPDRDVREVDDHVCPFGQPDQQPVAVIGRDVDGGGEESALVPDLPHPSRPEPGGALPRAPPTERRIARAQISRRTGNARRDESRPRRCG